LYFSINKSIKRTHKLPHILFAQLLIWYQCLSKFFFWSSSSFLHAYARPCRYSMFVCIIIEFVFFLVRATTLILLCRYRLYCCTHLLLLPTVNYDFIFLLMILMLLVPVAIIASITLLLQITTCNYFIAITTAIIIVATAIHVTTLLRNSNICKFQAFVVSLLSCYMNHPSL